MRKLLAPNISLLLLVATAILLGLSVLAPTQAIPGLTCNALVEVTNDLYLVDSNGVQLARFTNDGVRKQSVALSPDGTKVAFIPNVAVNSFTIADGAGVAQPYPVPPSDSRTNPGTFVGVGWATDTIVRLDKHIGKNSDRFEFYSIGNSSLSLAADPGFGSVCVLQPTDDDVACLQGNDVLVGPKTVYTDNALASAPQLGSLTLMVGSSGSLDAAPGVQIQVVSIASGVTLHVTLPTGNWIESRVSSGSFLPVQLEDQTLALFPTVTDSTKGIVTIVVRSNSAGPNLFDNAAAWQMTRDPGLTLVKNISSGRTIMFLSPGKRPWTVLAQAPLTIGEPIDSMRFVTPTLLYFETRAEFGILPVVIAQSPSGPVLQLGTINTLPKTLNVNVTGSPSVTPVTAWACNQ